MTSLVRACLTFLVEFLNRSKKQQPVALNCSALVAGTPSGLLEFSANAAFPKEKIDAGCCVNVAVNGKLKAGDVAAAAAEVWLTVEMTGGSTASLLVTATDCLLSHSAAASAKLDVTQAADALQQFGTSPPLILST